MSKQEIIRTFNFDSDYDRVMHLWKYAGEGIQLRRSDEPAEILKKIKRDPDLFLICEVEDEIIGAVLGGYDGRRGMMYHLAVDHSYRNTGVATRLVEELESRLRKKDCSRYYLLVTQNNDLAIRFYENRGWEKLDLFVYAKDL